MGQQIEKKIVGFAVKKPDEETQAEPAKLLEREEVLEGSTYKIKTPHSEHAMYITINDVVDDSGVRRPFEVFINSKNMEHFMWIVALTRIVSAIFRKGGDVTFLVEELSAVFDPRGGHYKKGGRYMPSVVAEIGDVIKQHLISIGMIDGQIGGAELEAKRKEAEEKLGSDAIAKGSQCDKCGEMAVVRLDNCNCCLSCGSSSCG